MPARRVPLGGARVVALRDRGGGFRLGRLLLARVRPHLLAPHEELVPVLDGDVRAAGELLRDERPCAAELGDRLQQLHVLLLRPRRVRDVGREVVEPALADLAGGPVREDRGDPAPGNSTVLLDGLADRFVLLGAEAGARAAGG